MTESSRGPGHGVPDEVLADLLDGHNGNDASVRAAGSTLVTPVRMARRGDDVLFQAASRHDAAQFLPTSGTVWLCIEERRSPYRQLTVQGEAVLCSAEDARDVREQALGYTVATILARHGTPPTQYLIDLRQADVTLVEAGAGERE